MFIQSGAATLVVGGELVDRRGTPPELTGTDIAGGRRYEVGAGDVLHIPADTPHRYLVPEGGQVTYLLVRLPALTGARVLPGRRTGPRLPARRLRPVAGGRAGDRRQALARQMRPDHSSRETLADYGSPIRSHRFRHIHRDADGVPEIHDDIIDVVLITSGEGGILAGGAMLDRNGSFGSGIDGGTSYPVTAGDVLHIPAQMPHGYLVPDGGHVTYVLVRVPAVGAG